MLVARLGDRAANRAFAERWWHGAVRGTDVLFPAGESMAVALRHLKEKQVDWQTAVTWFKVAFGKVQTLAAERSGVAAALTRLSQLEQACEEASGRAEATEAWVAVLTARELSSRDVVTTAEEDFRAALAALGAHELSRPAVTTVTSAGVAAMQTRGALSVALAGGVRRGKNWREWSVARRAKRVACGSAEERWKAALRESEAVRAQAIDARLAAAAAATEVARLATEIEPLAEMVAAARVRWGDHVPAGPSQSETEDPALIEWRETTAPWADDEYTAARVQAFMAALELHKALIAAQTELFEANLAALMELIGAETRPADDARLIPAGAHPDGGQDGSGTGGSSPDGAGTDGTEVDGTGPDGSSADGAGTDGGAVGGGAAADVLLAAWQSFFLVVPAVHVPFEAAGSLLDGLGRGTLGWLLAGGTDQLATAEVDRLLHQFKRAVLAGDGVPLGDSAIRYGTWLQAGSAETAQPAEPRWVGLPLRVVRGQDRSTVDRRNDLADDGLLIAEPELTLLTSAGLGQHLD